MLHVRAEFGWMRVFFKFLDADDDAPPQKEISHVLVRLNSNER